MNRLGRLCVALLAVLALSAVVMAEASAAEPEFLGKEKAAAKGIKFKATGKNPKLKAAGVGVTITCTAFNLKEEGEITGPKTVGKVFIVFTGCKAGATCPVHNKGFAEASEEIVTTELEGELGIVAKAEAPMERGLKLKPVKSPFVSIAGQKTCIPNTEVTGSVIGEILPVKKLSLTGELNFFENGGKQKIQKFVGGAVSVLKAFGLVEVVQEAEAKLTFTKEVEVT